MGTAGGIRGELKDMDGTPIWKFKEILLLGISWHKFPFHVPKENSTHLEHPPHRPYDVP